MKLELENINNLIVDDLDLRNRNWTAIDDSLELKADKTHVDTQLSEKADLSEIEGARGTEATLGARLDSTDAQLSDIATDTSLPLTNFLSNSDFSNGVTGWLGLGATLAVVDGKLNCSGNGTTSISAYQNTPKPLDMDKVIGGTVKFKINSQCKSLGIYIRGTTSGVMTRIKEIVNPTPNMEYEVSYSGKTISAMGTGNIRLYITAGYGGVTTTASDILTIDLISGIDLTESFGVGEEPDEKVLHDFLERFDSRWFEGTVNGFNGKKLLIDQLKISPDTIADIQFKNKFGLNMHFFNSNHLTLTDTGAVHTIFPLEHRLNTDKAGQYSTDEFYGLADGRHIYKTTDGIKLSRLVNLDETFTGDNYLLNQFTLANGKHLCFNKGTLAGNKKDIELYSADYTTRDVIGNYGERYYPNHGIDQNPFTKTVCWAEYPPDSALTASVYRLASPFTTPQKVLELNSWGFGAGRDIRHFHVCAADPFVSGRWYLTSGDDALTTHMWVSTDDGVTWTKVINGDVRVRTVQMFIDSSNIYFSEDNTGGGFYRMDKNTFEITELVPKGNLSGQGYSCTITPHGFVLFYNKTPGGIDPNHSYVYLVDFKTFEVTLLAKTTADFRSYKSRKASPSHGAFYAYVENDISFSGWGTSRLAICRLINL